jgi:5-formyltetrahydrofolate cyclo-ligase
MDLAGEKKRLRERIGALRDAMTAQEHADASAAICERLWRLCCGTKADESLLVAAPIAELPRGFALAAYMPHRSEADIAPLIERCWRTGAPVALPKAEPRERQLRFYYARGVADLAVGAYGIREPLPTLPEATAAELAALDVLLVPGLAFDESLRRLGYGGGYYDRLLARLAALPATVPADASEIGGTPSVSGRLSLHADGLAAFTAQADPPAGAAPQAAPGPGASLTPAPDASPALAASAPRRRPLLVAAAFELQLVDAVPTEPHDFPLDAIVTERRIILRRG